MRKRHRSISFLLALLLVVALLGGTNAGGTGIQAAGELNPKYNYLLEVSRDWTSVDKAVIIDLYVIPSTHEQVLDGGCFGLRYPVRYGTANVTFTPNSDQAKGHVSISPVVPQWRVEKNASTDKNVIQKDEYIVFSWIKNSRVESWPVTAIGTGAAQANLFIGTFTFSNLVDTPKKGDIGMMRFLDTAEAVPSKEELEGAAVPDDLGIDIFNKSVWDASHSLYMGYRVDNTTGALERLPIGLLWNPPANWKNAFTIMAYDPKKPLTMQLFLKSVDDKGVTTYKAATRPTVPTQWVKDVTKADSGELFAATSGNVNTGIGAYFWAVTFQNFYTPELNPADKDVLAAAVPGGDYILRISKPGHLTIDMPLKADAVSTAFQDCTGFPADGKYYTLPCGDVNPVRGAEVATPYSYTYGDGEIKLIDRTLLTAYLNGAMDAEDEESPTVLEADEDEGLKIGDPNPAYYADLDGDGEISLKDMSILLSADNYNQKSNADYSAIPKS